MWMKNPVQELITKNFNSLNSWAGYGGMDVIKSN